MITYFNCNDGLSFCNLCIPAAAACRSNLNWSSYACKLPAVILLKLNDSKASSSCTTHLRLLDSQYSSTHETFSFTYFILSS